MANVETQKLDSIIASRRSLLVGGAAAIAAMALPKAAEAAQTVSTYGDTDILNFALNLEYLEANFYYLAAFGSTIDNPTTASIALGQPSTAIGIGAGTATSGTRATYGTATNVPFALPAVKAYAIETAIEEGKHVSFLRSALGSAAVAQPAIDLSPAGAFTTLATAAGLSTAGAPLVTGGYFNPYANDVAFLAGAYVFEDVGVTAYKGAAPLISTSTTGKVYLQAAASILAVEAYHSGLIRTSILVNDQTGANGYLGATQKVAQLRTYLAQNAGTTAAPTNYTPDDFGLQLPGVYPKTGTVASGPGAPPTQTTVTIGATTVAGPTNVADADPTNVIAFGRTTAQVLNIVTGMRAATGTKNQGVFFPSGLNGIFA